MPDENQAKPGAPAEENLKTKISQQVTEDSDRKGCESAGDKLDSNQAVNTPAGGPEAKHKLEQLKLAIKQSNMSHIYALFKDYSNDEVNKKIENWGGGLHRQTNLPG